MKKICFILGSVLIFGSSVFGQTKYDTIFNYISNSPVTIDGQADEACWSTADWIEIGQTWIPYNASVPASDFEGRFKVSWDSEYLYLLVEIHDDSLSDDHADPLQNWWDDDCVEIFIDENRSLGNHQTNNNAFAYHVSLFYDAVDTSPTGGPINYKDHITVDMDTIGEDLYLWEFAIKLYDASYNNSNPDASRVYPENGKIMGFSLAYCDNDETTSRENFIGTMTLTAGTANNSYIDATIFGVMKLIDPDAVSIEGHQFKDQLSIYPNPSEDYFIINSAESGAKELSLLSLDGKVLLRSVFEEKRYKVNLDFITSGTYLVRVKDSSGAYTRMLLVK